MKLQFPIILTVIGLLTLLSLVVTSCSPSSSMENKLLGDWQSNGPEIVRLKFTKTTTSNDGFHDGYSETRNGRTVTQDDWRIDKGELILQERGVFNDMLRNTSQGAATRSYHRIVELTADRFVVEWTNARSIISGVPDRQEYRRVN